MAPPQQASETLEPGEIRIRPGRRKSLHQALDIQRLVYDTIRGSNVRPADLASLARAWDILEERKRILRGKPLPGSLKPTTPKAKKPGTLTAPLDIAQDNQESPANIEGNVSQAGKESLPNP